MRTQLALLLLSLAAQLVFGSFPIRQVPGVYEKAFGEFECPNVLRIGRAPNMEPLINDSKGLCKGANIPFLFYNWKEADGNKLSSFLSFGNRKEIRQRSRVDSFIIAKLLTDLKCPANRNGTFVASNGTILNFFGPSRDTSYNFTNIFGRRVGISAADGKLLHPKRFLTMGDQCLYTRTRAVDCFPAEATVELRNGSRKRMDQLQIGDEVLVAPRIFAPVFMWTHRDDSIVFDAVQIVTASQHSLVLSPGHFIYINGVAVPAVSTKVGDLVILGDWKSSRVVAVQIVHAKGLYNPHTMYGDIVVDGIQASTFTTAIDHHAAHALLAPLRLAHRMSMASWLRRVDICGEVARKLLL